MITVQIPFKAQITFDQKNSEFQFKGSLQLQEKIKKQVQLFGQNPEFWIEETVRDGSDVLLNEFILKVKKKYELPYQHQEICHCRMVPTEKVTNRIKCGVFSVTDVCRLTMAGTGCGSCKKDIEEIINYLVK